MSVIKGKVYIFVLFLLFINSVSAFHYNSTNYKVQIGTLGASAGIDNSSNYVAEEGVYTVVGQNESINYKACVGFFCFIKNVFVGEVVQNVTITQGGGGSEDSATVEQKTTSLLMSLFGGDSSFCKDEACVAMIRNRSVIVLVISFLVIFMFIFLMRKKNKNYEGKDLGGNKYG